MNQTRSLRLRLLLAAAVGITLSAILAASILFFAFRRHAETLASNELERSFVQLASGLQIGSEGFVTSQANLSDPRFQKPYGGLYWQINETGSRSMRSPSLFDYELQKIQLGDKSFGVIPGPENKPVFALCHALQLTGDNGIVHNILVIVAVERADVDAVEASFKRDLLFGFALLAGALFAGAVAQLLLGLKPLRDLQLALSAMKSSGANKLDGQFPSELQPLISNLNDMLAAREDALERARQRASNMAHGIKTPITILMAAGEDMAKAGQHELANTVTENASLIREQIDRQLARARMASGHSKTATPLRVVVERVVNTLSRTSEGEKLKWEIAIPESASLFVERHDLFELLGNLADNASKWAKSTVRVSFNQDILRVEDDGPGVPADKLAEITQRGFKLDSKRSGHGLGLSIVAELAESYGFTVKYQRSDLGGLSVAIAKSESFAAESTLQN